MPEDNTRRQHSCVREGLEAQHTNVIVAQGLPPRGLRAQSSAVPSGAEGKQAGLEDWKLKKSEAPPREVFERSREASGAGGLETQEK
jgi:hypothetical protein